MFQKYLDHDYETWCKRHGLKKSDEGLITFLIDKDLIPASIIQRYAISREFEEMCKDPLHQKTQAVNSLAHRFNISERTVWNILRHEKEINAKR